MVAKSSPRLLSDSVEALTRDVAAEANTSILLLLLLMLLLHVLPQMLFFPHLQLFQTLSPSGCFGP